LKPSPSRPSRFSCGTSTSSNFGAPSFQPGIPIVRSGSALRPGDLPSTTNALMPPAPAPPVRANTT
jgi:hypothetical protein